MTPRSVEQAKPEVHWIPEPVLSFAGGAMHVDPKVGIAGYGPYSLADARHPTSVVAGFIGTAETAEIARQWLEKASCGVDGGSDYTPFPGYTGVSPFKAQLRLDGPAAYLTQRELRPLLAEGVRRWAAFEELSGMIDTKLRQLASLDSPPGLVFIVLPGNLLSRYRTVTKIDRGVDTTRNLRGVIKARAMIAGLRTQLLDPGTIESSLTKHEGDLDHPADLAWNLFVGVYFKGGGFPWAPVGIPEGTCHMGVTFYRPHGERSAMRTSVAQAFSETGDAFVLRGSRFEWEGKWPHLPEQESARLVTDVLARYAAEMGRPAKRVVVHKQSRFFPEERAGFEDALKNVEYDLVALAPSTSVRLMRHGQYPPARGAALRMGKRQYLYTTGWVPALGGYPQGHVPSPLQITDHVGDASTIRLLSEILLLTKMNWNSAKFAERIPVTLRFADEVGAILRDLAEDAVPEHRYAFYM